MNIGGNNMKVTLPVMKHRVMRNCPYTGIKFISQVVFAQEQRLSELGFKIGFCHVNDQEQRIKTRLSKFIP